jgi:branched-chain amino acid transport system permease protein
MRMNWVLLLQLVWDGMAAGAIYALMAFSFSLIYFTTRVLHFAHGAVMVVLTYVIYIFANDLGLSWPLAACAAIPVGFGIGVLFELLLYRQMRKRAATATSGAFFIVSLGAALVITNVLPLIFGAETTFLQGGPVANAVLIWHRQIALTNVSLWTVPGSVALLALALIWLRKTEGGRMIRAIIDEPHTAEVVGIPIGRVYLIVFGLGSAFLVAVALNAVLLRGAQSQIGHPLMIATLTATIIGGLGSLSGAVVGGYLLGLVSNVALYWLPTSFGDATVYTLLLIFIALRPLGLFGHQSALRAA